MTEAFNTVRTSVDATLPDFDSAALQQSLFSKVTSEWARARGADLVDAIHRYPQILGERSVLLDLAIEEYKLLSSAAGDVELEQHCARFGAFGRTLQQSIFRQLETQRFLDKHPELMDLVRQPEWPEPGEQLGEFEVLQELGRGALSRVYLCRDESLGNRQVVVKVKPYEDFEAAILGGLDHPNIMPIHSTGSFEDRRISFLCMPFCGRSTLIDVIDEAFGGRQPRSAQAVSAAATRWAEPGDRPVSGTESPRAAGRLAGTYVDAVLRLAIPLAEALAHAHAAGVVHGDLKPSNVLLTPQGKPLLFDFNLSQSSLADDGPRGGTLPYMPPEHLESVARGRDADSERPCFDVRSDVYSFGAVLYELLRGTVPFAMASCTTELKPAALALLEEQRKGPPSLRDGDPLISPRLDALVRSCLAVAADRRPASMGEVARILGQEAGIAATLARSARARPRRAAALALAGCLAVGVPAFHLATRPAADVRAFQAAIVARSEGRLDEAIRLQTVAVGLNPTYEYRFERARTLMEAQRLDEAKEEFRALEKETGDPIYSALIGYCFNLNGVHLAAVEWYERALNSDLKNVAVLNNLGASYGSVDKSQVSPSERLALANHHLRSALQRRAQSLTIKLNLAHVELTMLLSGLFSPDMMPPLQIDVLVETEDQNVEVMRVAAFSYALMSNSHDFRADMAVAKTRRALELGAADKSGDIQEVLDSADAGSASSLQRLTRLMMENSWPARDGQVPIFLDPLSDQ